MSMILWTPGVKLEEVEKQVILKALAFYRSNKTQTASSLGISIRTLDARLEEYRLQDEKEAERVRLSELEHERKLREARGLPIKIDNVVAISQNVSSEQQGVEEKIAELTAEQLIAEQEKLEASDDMEVDLSEFEEPVQQKRAKAHHRR